MILAQQFCESIGLLLEHQPLVFFHLVTALAALLVGAIVLARRKGTGDHKALGWTWVLLMVSTAGPALSCATTGSSTSAGSRRSMPSPC